MAKIFLHVYDKGISIPTNTEIEMNRVPCVGEYIDTATDDEDYFKVEIVVHCPFADSDYVAEVWAYRVNHLEVLKPFAG